MYSAKLELPRGCHDNGLTVKNESRSCTTTLQGVSATQGKQREQLRVEYIGHAPNQNWTGCVIIACIYVHIYRPVCGQAGEVAAEKAMPTGAHGTYTAPWTSGGCRSVNLAVEPVWKAARVESQVGFR